MTNMRSQLIRPLLVFEFLIAIEVLLTLWSEVGGQYDLDLMFWPWKFGVAVVTALLITAITAALVKSEGVVTRRVYLFGSLLILTMALAGLVTYYYHLHEPSDEDDSVDQTTITRLSYGGDAASATPADR